MNKESRHHLLTALIADDEPLARKRMRRLLQSGVLASHIHVLTEEAKNGSEVLNLALQLKPDIIFLDIHMPEGDGMTLGKQLIKSPIPPAIIYCTAYEQHAIDAFRVGAIDYLLKPVQYQQLQEAINRIMAQNQQGSMSTNAPFNIEVPSEKGASYISSDTIICLHAEEKYTRLYHQQGSVLINISLKTLMTRLPDSFIRIHRKTIIALPAVLALEKHTNNSWSVKLQGLGEKFIISRRSLGHLKKMIKKGTGISRL